MQSDANRDGGRLTHIIVVEEWHQELVGVMKPHVL